MRLADNDDAVAGHENIPAVGADEDRVFAFALGELLRQMSFERGVEPVGRFVEKKKRRIEQERAGESHELALTA